MFVCMGYPPELARIQRAIYIYGDFTRHLKIAGSYGEPLKSTCGMGQECSLAFIAANAIVASEVNMLSEKTPEVEKTAFIDDRTLDSGSLQQLTEAIVEVAEVDNTMGHTTNNDNSKILVAAKRDRNKTAKTVEIRVGKAQLGV